jgi:hypothetical protein
MPYRFDFDPVNKILRAYFEGQVGDEEMRRYYFQDARKIVAKLHFDAAIVDFSAVTKFDLSSSLVNEMAAYKPVVATVPIFIVAPATHIFGTSRMFQILGGRTRPMLHVVQLVEEAYARLNVVKPKFEPIPED